MLKNAPELLERCPKCNYFPFTSSGMRGLVQRHKLFWIFTRNKYCAIICDNCRSIVGYENPKERLLTKRLLGIQDGTGS